MGLEQLFFSILIANLIGFGGLSSLPVLRGQLLSAGLPADPLLLQALAVGNISPGPNGLYLIATGYFVAGIKGALVAALALMVPPPIVLILEHVRSHLIHLHRFRAALNSLSIAVVALLALSNGTLALHAATDGLGIAMVAVGVALLLRGLPSLYGIGIAVAAGVLFS